jgi:hypothetical protein
VLIFTMHESDAGRGHPRRISEAGAVTNELMAHNDWFPTLATLTGEPAIVENERLQGNGRATSCISTASTSPTS